MDALETSLGELAFWLKTTEASQNNLFTRAAGNKYYCIFQGLTEGMKHFQGNLQTKIECRTFNSSHTQMQIFLLFEQRACLQFYSQELSFNFNFVNRLIQK